MLTAKGKQMSILNIVTVVSNDGTINLSLSPGDDMGNVFKGVWTLDGSRPVSWLSDNPNITTTSQYNGLSCIVKAIDPTQPISATITCTAWIKLGLPLPSQPGDYTQMVATTKVNFQPPQASCIVALPSSPGNWVLTKQSV